MSESLSKGQAARLTPDQEELILQQRRTISELQTPVVEVWEGILLLPIVGTLDTARTQEMNERLLNKIVEAGSEIVLLDITGVPVIDTAIAKHLLETISAARLLGAEVMVVGISASTAMTLVHLGLDLSNVITRTNLSRGLRLAFSRLGLEVVRRREGGAALPAAEADGSI